MSKNITIAEGTQAKNFNNVAKIRTNLIGGGTQNWVPEDEAGKYADLEDISISENGTYYADDEGVDGFSVVRVNVSGGEGQLITKEITANGTYNAIDDNADGYSQVIVNVPFPQHGRTIVDGINNAPVSQRISTYDFINDFDEKLFTVIEPQITNALYRQQWENVIRLGGWLDRYNVREKLNRNDLILIGGGAADSGFVYVWMWAIGILDETAQITITDATPSGFTASLTTGDKFTAHTGGMMLMYNHRDSYGVGGFGIDSVISDLNNHVGGQNPRVIEYAYAPGTYGRIDLDSKPAKLNPMTNLTGGTVG